jgi:hypothetical protein
MKPDKIYLSLGAIVLFTIFSWATSCTHIANIANLPEVCFTGEVLPIFINNCAISGCHDGGGGEAMALNSYSSILHNISPGNPDASELYKVIISKWGVNRMPPSQPLSMENRTKIRVWIEQGATETICSTGVTKMPVGSSLSACRVRQFELWIKNGYSNN